MWVAGKRHAAGNYSILSSRSVTRPPLAIDPRSASPAKATAISSEMQAANYWLRYLRSPLRLRVRLLVPWLGTPPYETYQVVARFSNFRPAVVVVVVVVVIAWHLANPARLPLCLSGIILRQRDWREQRLERRHQYAAGMILEGYEAVLIITGTGLVANIICSRPAWISTRLMEMESFMIFEIYELEGVLVHRQTVQQCCIRYCYPESNRSIWLPI